MNAFRPLIQILALAAETMALWCSAKPMVKVGYLYCRNTNHQHIQRFR